MEQPSYFSIDVSKHRLDVAVPGMPKLWRTSNDASGIAAQVRQVRRLATTPTAITALFVDKC